MAIINTIDLGAHATWRSPLSTRKGTIWGSDVQNVVIEGSQSIIWSRAGAIRKRTEMVWIVTSPPSSTTALATLRQLQETANNPALQPVYIQWASGGGNIVADPEDGWYVLETVTPNTEVTIDGIIPVEITVSYVTTGISLKSLAIAYSGSIANIGYIGSAIAEVAFPLNADSMPATILSRPGAEGSMSVSTGPNTTGIVSPLYFRSSSTVSDLFKTRCSVWDTVNTSSFPVPTGGAFVDSHWIEILHPDHLFQGDCVITNGHILLLFAEGGQTNFIQAWVWNWITPGWIATIHIQGFEPAANIFSTVGFSIQTISHYESSIKLFLVSSPPVNQQALITVRVVRGEYYARLQFTPLTYSVSTVFSMSSATPSNPKLQYTEGSIKDPTLTAERNFNFPVDTNYGWTAQFTNNSSFPFITGFLYLDSTSLVGQGSSAQGGLSIGDSSRPLINQSRFYGLFMLPLATPQNYQAEGESGTLDTGWSSIADANGSAGNTAKVASGTVTARADLFGTSFVPVGGGLYNIWFRVRVTSAAGTTAEITLGWWDATAAGFLALASTTYAAKEFSTSYTWVCVNTRTVADGVLNGTTTVTSASAVFTAADVGKAISGSTVPAGATISSITNATTIVISSAVGIGTGSGVTLIIGAPATPVAAHNMQFRAVTAATLGTDYFVDEGGIAPLSGVGSSAQGVSPRECWQAFVFDKTSKLISV